MQQRPTLPLDVRFMNGVATLLLLGVALAALGSAGWWLAQRPFWALGRIVVDGDVAHQDEVIFRSHLAPQLRGSFLTLDLLEVKALFEQVPWVRQAVVRREFPNRLRVTLDEHEAAAWWGETGSGKMVNLQGEIFAAEVDEVEADLFPELAGPEGRAGQVHALYRQLQPQLRPLQQEIRRLELGASGHWRISLAGGTLIELGRGEPAELLARLQRFSSTLPQLLSRYGARNLESVDLRYPNGYAVRMQGVKTATDDKAAAALAARIRKKK
jgi:cell division protein FtsQ